MSSRVRWLQQAKDKVPSNLVPRLIGELVKTFPNADEITVTDCLHGYSLDQKNRVVLAVEVKDEKAYRTHVVKLGSVEDVGRDIKGWEKCMRRRSFASRVFVPVSHKNHPSNRIAVVYQDAYILYGPDKNRQSPLPLEVVVTDSIENNHPDPESVERVIRQIFNDLSNWFYQGSTVEREDALWYYKGRLDKAFGEWETDPHRADLRRDLIWLFHKEGKPVPYEDPFDYVRWAIAHEELPDTLVGRSHGDLHGRNILVGVQRGEAEYPAVFDYGEMDDKNVLAWDFVKLETELKVRLLQDLYEKDRPKPARGTMKLRGEARKRALQIPQFRFALQFEWRLARMTGLINVLRRAGTRVTEEVELLEQDDEDGLEHWEDRGELSDEYKRALQILIRIRKEAALHLGAEHRLRKGGGGGGGVWRNEYYFALAVYGLSTAKYNYESYETIYALISTGVAVAQLGEDYWPKPPRPIDRVLPEDPLPFPTYRIAKADARRLWKKRGKKDLDEAQEFLESLVDRYEHAVPLLYEYCLILAEKKEHGEVVRKLSPLEDLAAAFGDEETLSLLGRIHKEQGDTHLTKKTTSGGTAQGAARQSYKNALRSYQKAYMVSGDYFPGINAASCARLCGEKDRASEFAREVRILCGNEDFDNLTPEGQFWVRVTQGEASILLREADDAVAFYEEALRPLQPNQVGMAQSALKQVLRLSRDEELNAMAKTILGVFKTANIKLDP